MESENQKEILADAQKGNTKVQVGMVESNKEQAIIGTPVRKESLPDLLFKEEKLLPEERVFINVYMTHFLLMYRDGDTESPIELPPGIPHTTRMMLHYIADTLELGSFARGSKKGGKRRLLIGPMSLAKERFEKAKKGRDTLIWSAIKRNKLNSCEPLEVIIQRESHEIAEEQEKNSSNGLSFQQSWAKLCEGKTQEGASEVNKDVQSLQDGKDWSLSTDDFNIYISGENKDVINRDAFDDTNQTHYDEDPVDEEMESEESSFDDQFEEQKTNNIEKKGIENITLENFQARPDKIIELWAAKVTDQSAEIAWEIPDCNNSEITEYTIKTKELSKDTRSLTFQSVHRAVDNSVTIEDLLPETWYLIDIRAVNEYGYCPISSKMLAVRTLPLEKGSLYAWGSNKNDELGLSEEDTKSPYFNKAKSVAMGPICVNAFKNFATDVSSSDGITLTTISSPTPLNLIQAGVTFDLEDDEPTIVHSKEEAFRQIFSLPFCQPIKNAKDIFEQVVKVECGMNFAVALTTSGKVYSWGISGSGQLGQENNPEKDSNNSSEITAVRRPLMIKDLNWDDDFVMDVAVGFTHCIALTYKRRVFIWGESCDFPHHKISDVSHDLYTSSALYPREIKTMIADYEPMQVFAGTLFSGILTTDGKLLTFGIGNSGQLGHLDKADSDGKEFGFLYIPKRVDALDDYFIENVSFGGCHVLVTARKKLMINETDFKIEGPCQTFAWGSNVQGQCACGADQQISLPKKLDVFDNKEVLQISAGIDHSLFLVQEEDGSTAVYSCGNAVDGACGVSKSLTGKFSSPKHIKTLDKKRKLTVKEGLGKVIKIKAGSKTSFAIIESE